MATATEPTVTVYDIETDTVLYRIPATEARRDLNMHRDVGDTVHEYDTTDRAGTPLHVTITVDLPRRGCVPDQGAVYVCPGAPVTTVDVPPAPQPETKPLPMTWEQALTEAKTKGVGRCSDHAAMAAFCNANVQHAVGAVSPQLIWEGAMKKGMSLLELGRLAGRDPLACSELMWV